MDDEETAKQKLKKLTSVKDLSTAIENLEIKKEAMENDFKDKTHYFLENVSPVKILDHTLQTAQESSSSKYALFKEALAYGAGYLPKKKLIHRIKNALTNTFKSTVNGGDVNLKVKPDEQRADEDASRPTNNEEKNNSMNSQIERMQIEKVKAKPDVLPEPTYWPFFLALGIVFLGWGLLTTWLISMAGLIILIISLTGWINILRHE